MYIKKHIKKNLYRWTVHGSMFFLYNSEVPWSHIERLNGKKKEGWLTVKFERDHLLWLTHNNHLQHTRAASACLPTFSAWASRDLRLFVKFFSSSSSSAHLLEYRVVYVIEGQGKETADRRGQATGW